MYNFCIMKTINISLPGQLKIEAEELVEKGYYASFSDMVRTALRKLLDDNGKKIPAKKENDRDRLANYYNKLLN